MGRSHSTRGAVLLWPNEYNPNDADCGSPADSFRLSLFA